MGNTPSHAHGSPARGDGAGPSLGRAGSTSRRHAPNLRLPMPQRPPAHVSPQSSNPTSPSGRPGSPRRRKSLELPDMQKLSFTPAAPQPTTATTTSNANAAPNAKAPAAAAPAPPAPAPANANAAAAAPPPTSPGSSRKWQQALGGRVASPLGGPGLAPMSKVDNKVIPGVTVVPVNDSSTYFPSQPIPIRSPRAGAADLAPATAAANAHERPHPPSASRRPEVKPADTPVRTGLTPPPPTVSPTPPPAADAGTAANDGLVDVPIQWNGGGKNVYVTGNFADKWRGRIKLKKSTHDFNTILRLAPGQYRLKFIVDDSWRCSKAIPTATDDDGTLVNWIEVESPKTEAELQAEWAMDSKPAVKAEDVDDSQWTSEIPASLVLYQYLEELPQMFPPDVLKQYVASSPYFSPVPKPPQLPRILEKVILNTDTRRPDPREQDGPPTVGIDDNSILATPSHAVLNHLMASAIKNGTLGVGTTTRYRKKYITTMFFRPTPSDLMPTQEQAAAGAAAAASGAAPATTEANGAAAPPADAADPPAQPAEHAAPVPPAAAQ
ncbi:5'-AMP-activated protein kinase subunit beta [Vanrija pseudolonga]|uniref:5'-AMP-activated protein kinase subunit beta n=1 Tax=Vanrija pseudolonga TaxID=143232 RepID=A0AAF0Y0Y8_9TREE|nr:5'-AMP-activated protein kinase subunit beta [Vanrija pseudolonga]